MLKTIKIFVMPPLLTLAVAAVSTMTLMDYLTQRSLRTTYVISSLKQSGFCALCHDGTYTQIPLRLALRPGRLVRAN